MQRVPHSAVIRKSGAPKFVGTECIHLSTKQGTMPRTMRRAIAQSDLIFPKYIYGHADLKMGAR